VLRHEPRSDEGEHLRPRPEPEAPAPPVASVLALQRTAGNQAVARLAARRRLQRMIVVGDATADIGRLVAVHNLHARFPGHAVEYLANADLASMKPGETLYISAHGSPDTVGHLDPVAFAKLLLQQGLRDGTAIDLKACSSAVPSDSFVEKLEHAILEESGGLVWVQILGYTGTHAITREGGSIAKDAGKNVGALKAEYQAILARHKSELDAAKIYDQQAVQQGKSLEERATHVAQLTSSLFDELYAYNPKVAQSSDTATGTSRILSELDPLFAKGDLLDLIRLRESRLWSQKPASYIA
jgi:hypothetical protein